MSDSSQYDRFPQIPSGSREECVEGWPAITREIRARAAARSAIIIECYPGVFLDELAQALASAFPNVEILRTPDLFRPPAAIDSMLQPWLTDDPVFGIMNSIEIEDFFDPARLAEARARCASASQLILILGPGASLVCPQPALLVYADLARWEIQRRQRRNQIPNLGLDNFQQRPSLKYKRAFFVDWRAADRLKRRLLPKIDLLLDTNLPNQPKAISGDT